MESFNFYFLWRIRKIHDKECEVRFQNIFRTFPLNFIWIKVYVLTTTSIVTQLLLKHNYFLNLKLFPLLETLTDFAAIYTYIQYICMYIY